MERRGIVNALYTICLICSLPCTNIQKATKKLEGNVALQLYHNMYLLAQHKGNFQYEIFLSVYHGLSIRDLILKCHRYLDT